MGYGRGSAGALVPVVQVSQDGNRQDEPFFKLLVYYHYFIFLLLLFCLFSFLYNFL